MKSCSTSRPPFFPTTPVLREGVGPAASGQPGRFRIQEQPGRGSAASSARGVSSRSASGVTRHAQGCSSRRRTARCGPLPLSRSSADRISARRVRDAEGGFGGRPRGCGPKRSIRDNLSPVPVMVRSGNRGGPGPLLSRGPRFRRRAHAGGASLLARTRRDQLPGAADKRVVACRTAARSTQCRRGRRRRGTASFEKLLLGTGAAAPARGVGSCPPASSPPSPIAVPRSAGRT